MSYFGHFTFPGKILPGAIFCMSVFVMCAAGQAPGTPAPVMDSASLRTDGGMTTVTFNVAAGRLKVFLPDEIRSGDTISGTVTTEPAGNDETEKAKNTVVLQGLSIFLGDQKTVTPESGPKFTWIPKSPSPAAPSRYIIRISEILPSQNAPAVYARMYPVGTPSPSAYTIPVLGQTGRPIVINGPFDGNSDNTKCTVGGAPCRIIAESPRKVVIQIPAEPVGSTTISIGEDKTTSAPFRNVGINLSASKTSLMKGEKTTVGVQVTGLSGITNSVTVQLVTTGAVNMEGGNTQTVQISPGQVGPDGKAFLTKTITGVEPGSFNVTGNVLQ
jgi:hypothetical protein